MKEKESTNVLFASCECEPNFGTERFFVIHLKSENPDTNLSGHIYVNLNKKSLVVLRLKFKNCETCGYRANSFNMRIHFKLKHNLTYQV